MTRTHRGAEQICCDPNGIESFLAYDEGSTHKWIHLRTALALKSDRFLSGGYQCMVASWFSPLYYYLSFLWLVKCIQCKFVFNFNFNVSVPNSSQNISSPKNSPPIIFSSKKFSFSCFSLKKSACSLHSCTLTFTLPSGISSASTIKNCRKDEEKER